MSITIGCDIEGCKSSLVIGTSEEVDDALSVSGWGVSSPFDRDLFVDTHTCPSHNKDNK